MSRQCLCAADPGCAPAGPPGLGASYALDIDHVIIQARATCPGPCTGARSVPRPPVCSRPRRPPGGGEPHASGLPPPRPPRRQPHGHCHAPTSRSQALRLTPRPYQYEAVAALLAATVRGVQRPLLVLPTGTGKTIVFALLVRGCFRGALSQITENRKVETRK